MLVGLTTVLTRAQKLSEYAAHPIGVFNPYNFQYSVDHPDGSLSSRLEKGDQSAVTGSYQIVGANGLQRVSIAKYYRGLTEVCQLALLTDI